MTKFEERVLDIKIAIIMSLGFTYVFILAIIYIVSSIIKGFIKAFKEGDL